MANNEERISRLDAAAYHGLFGVKKNTFDLILNVLTEAGNVINKLRHQVFCRRNVCL